MKKILLVLFLLLPSVDANEIDDLLALYQSESELSKKTKDENAGHITVYTRDDLERMQVETLKDILKSIRFFRYLENRTGEPDLLNMDPILYNSKSIRIYLNNNELSFPITGSGSLLFGNIDMDFIDHVEIYTGFPSFEFGIEPATIVVRLYTKTAKKDDGSRIKFLGASHSSHKENIYTTGFVDELSYFVYANHSTSNQDSYTVESQTLSKDVRTNHFYGSLANKNYHFELNVLNVNHNALLGVLPYVVPQDTTIKRDFINASLESTFLDDTLTLSASYIRTSGQYEAQYSQPLPPLLGGYSDIKQDFTTDTLTLILQKKFELEMQSLSVGLQYRYKYFDFDDVTYDTVAIPYHQSYDQESIYSLFFEDAISLAPSHLVSLSVVQQYYDRNKKMKNESITQLRLSYIYSMSQWSAKTFLSRQEFIPEPYMTATAHTGNPNLDSEVYSSLTQEVNYKTPNTFSKMVLGIGKTKGYLIPDSHGVIQNSDSKLETYYGSLEFTYLFSKKDKLELAMDLTHLYLKDINVDVMHHDYHIRMLNTISKFDLFNELVINGGYRDVDTGYDYSAGIKYAATPDLHFGIKGENIFNTGLTRKYYYNLIPTSKQLEIPVIEQKFMISMDYLF
jgi:iron complex outermembrane receptor protein